ncbi:MAG: hypothetical protein K9I34_05930 [Bacteroidales bacterium]|nr:hypothetical protein [Bacteroidales bacterium]
MSTTTFKISFLLLGLSLFFASCDRFDNPVVDNSDTRDDALAESLFDNTSDVADEAYKFSSSASFKSYTANDTLFIGTCVTITLDTVSFPYLLTIDFGTTNCLCNDGKYRRGAIQVSFNGGYRQPGTVLSYSFNDYYVNDNKLEGSKVVTNNGYTADSTLMYSVQVIGTIYKANNAGVITWNADKTREWIEGINTWIKWDDVYLLEGTAEGVDVNGNNWSREITSPLRKELNCGHIVSGTMEFTRENHPTRYIDFGTGTCDDTITVTVNGNIYTVTLP